MMCPPFVSKMKLFIRHLALIQPNKMELLNANRHILDVAKTMLIHMSVPKYLWSDDVLSACHLINRMFSSVLDSKIHFSCLYPNKNVFSMTPRGLALLVLFRTYLLR